MDLKNYIKPFKMFGNLYFVGNKRVSVHMIKTEEGYIMIDTGWPDMYDDIIENMKALEIKPEEICAIFHSHGHIDHFGCTQKFKELSGAKTYISRIDNDIVNGKYDLSWANEAKLQRLPFFDCDVLIEDGDVFTFGSTTVRCVHTPGHTDGVMSFFINVTDGKETYIAGMHGGAGYNTLKSDFIERYGLSTDCRKIYRESLRKIAKEHVDIFIGNHPDQSNTEEKSKGNADVVDANEMQRFLDQLEETIDIFEKREWNI